MNYTLPYPTLPHPTPPYPTLCTNCIIIIIEIIITSGGENIAPVPIEARIKKHAPFIGNAMLIGDKKKFLTCLITLKVNNNASNKGPSEKGTTSLQRTIPFHQQCTCV